MDNVSKSLLLQELWHISYISTLPSILPLYHSVFPFLHISNIFTTFVLILNPPNFIKLKYQNRLI